MEIEARCEACGETFNPADLDDLVHLEREDGNECGGGGKLVGSWTSAKHTRIVRFSLDEASAHHWLSSAEGARSAGELGPEWNPLTDPGTPVSDLLYSAQQAAIVRGPTGAEIFFETDEHENEPGYWWFVHLTLPGGNVQRSHSSWSSLRSLVPPSQVGLERAIHILGQAVAEANIVLDRLADYATWLTSAGEAR